SVIDDTPVVYADPWGNTYTPSNYDLHFHGAITLRVALANSYNVPAVKLTNQLGVGTVLEMTHRLGITTLNDPPQHYGLPLTVGYTPQYTTAIWVGNANGEPMYNIIGIDGAGPIWHAVMTRLTRGHPAQPFLRPPGITLATVSGYSGLLAVPGSGWTITDVFA